MLIGWGFGLATLGIYSIALGLFTSGASVVDRLNGSLGIPVIRALVDEVRGGPDAGLLQVPLAHRRLLHRRRHGDGAARTAVLQAGLRSALCGGLYFALFGIKLVLMPMHLSGNFLFAQLRYRLMSMIGLLRSVIFLSGMALSVWLQSIHLMVVFIALENLPEILTYYSAPADRHSVQPEARRAAAGRSPPYSASICSIISRLQNSAA